jgi:6-phosphogluconolactonase
LIITDDIREVVNYIVRKAESLLKKKKYVVMGFPGGRSIKVLTEALKKERRLDWKRIQIFMIDERLVHITSTQSNFNLIYETLVRKTKIPKENIHPFMIKDETDYGLGRYEKEFRKYGGKFDIAFFGVGEDSHIGALFPNYTIKNKAESFFILHDSPKPPKDRMTLSRKLAEKTELGVFLFVGEGKKDAFKKFNDTNFKVEDCPAKIAYNLKEAVVFENLRQ